MSQFTFKIHPSIGIARVGNSQEYFLAPESIAAMPQPGKDGDTTMGGLPIRPGTEDTIIKSSELRDKDGAFKRQAARFRIFAYPDSGIDTYPAKGGQEITIGSVIDGREVADIVWTVHLANKKSSWFANDDDHGVVAYENGNTPTLRNLREGLDPYNTSRLRRLVIDAGPRALSGINARTCFDTCSEPTRGEGADILTVADYPKSFPGMHFDQLEQPQGPIESLGEMNTDDKGRLIVAGGHGKSAGWPLDEKDVPVPINGPVNNDQWFDDTSDGPVSATLVFKDGSTEETFGAWLVATDPSYAPQTLNVVSLYDEAYDIFLRKLALAPEIYRDGHFIGEYRPAFDDHIKPLFRATAQQLWNAYLPSFAIEAHKEVDAITADDNPDETIMAGLAYVRRPNPGTEATWKGQSIDVGAPLMPLALGDSSAAGGKPFLTPTMSQYHFLHCWSNKRYVKQTPTPLGAGEYLDRASLQNCLGGRFSPGIDMTWIIRETSMYIQDWQQGAGPFRIKHKPLDYRHIQSQGLGHREPFLTFGWIPRHEAVENLGLEPGDATKFMALPWHADYNSCAIHQTSPNKQDSEALFWSWPAQRPVTVYPAADYNHEDNELPAQRYSVRGPGTYPGVNSPDDKHDLANAGRFWDYRQMLSQWQDIGVVVQGTVIDDGKNYPDDVYLEVQSRLEDGPEELADPTPWPLFGGNDTATRKDK
ncbi:LodA/GoxA family CTQ-dependent oxidase [Thalassomonas sp. RHCl1]|uniref:LodA/GoxA family CTQ-dependent oxidase n=1 Tax=Thalassomonas sp. RHCl1 TaxID=2995320 RepID=UPI00248CED10|nr:LodA/GoxA family CTQ-dependent oxidase [Thalassomonas sp. RHCl1]